MTTIVDKFNDGSKIADKAWAMRDDVWNANPGLRSMFMKHNFL